VLGVKNVLVGNLGITKLIGFSRLSTETSDVFLQREWNLTFRSAKRQTVNITDP